MLPRPLFLAFALVAQGLLALTRGAAAPTPPVPVEPSDTIIRRDLDQPPPAVRLGLAAAPDRPHVTLGLRRIPVGRGPLNPMVGGVRFRLAPLRFMPQPESLAAIGGSEALLALLFRDRIGGLDSRPDSSLFLPAPVPVAPSLTLPATAVTGGGSR